MKSAIDSRSLSVDIGGFKLNFQEATEGLKKQVTDLQEKVAQLEGKISLSKWTMPPMAPPPQGPIPAFPAAAAPPAALSKQESKPEHSAEPLTGTEAPAGGITQLFQSLQAPAQKPQTVPAPPPSGPGEFTRLMRTLSDLPQSTPHFPQKILWVDDNSKLNAYEIANCQTQGATVDTASSTAEGLAKFETGHYQAVITDMGRKEGGSYDDSAGLTLINTIRKIDKTIPIFVYTATSQVKRKRKQVEAAGGNGITSSPVELFEMLRQSAH